MLKYNKFFIFITKDVILVIPDRDRRAILATKVMNKYNNSSDEKKKKIM